MQGTGIIFLSTHPALAYLHSIFVAGIHIGAQEVFAA
jgi:hypothetical protein